MVDEAAPVRTPAPNPLVRFLIELGPLVLFFGTNARYGLIPATGVFMVAIVVSLAISWRIERRLPKMLAVTAFFVLVFGGLTLILQDDLFIKLKPTIFNLLIGTALLVGLSRGKLYLEFVFDSALQLTERGWRALTLRYGLFCYLLAALNELVWRNFSNDAWVSFKVFGIMPLTMGFMVWQMFALKEELIEDES